MSVKIDKIQMKGDDQKAIIFFQYDGIIPEKREVFI